MMKYVLAGLAIMFAAFAAPSTIQAEDLPLRVMTYNVRYASPQPPNAWQDRRPVSKAMIEAYRPDLIGTQEGLYHQIKQMAEDLPDYDWIGLGRNGGSHGEFMAIFYRKDKFEPQEYDHFWLSDEPEKIGSFTWGNTLPRMVTWVIFKEKATGRRFYHFNTHFDHQSQPARDQSAALLLARVIARKSPLPVVITGDFNQAQGTSAHVTLLAENAGFKLTVAWEAAPTHTGSQVATFHGFRGENPSDVRIDWILLSPEFKANSTEVVTFQRNGQFPSDHYPVVADITLTDAPPAATSEGAPQP